MEHVVTQNPTEAGASGPEAPLVFTDQAVQMAKQSLVREGLANWGLRVGVTGGGCSGFQYAMNFDEHARPDDVVLEIDGLRVFVDSMSLEYLKGMTVDYVTGLHGAGFKFLNPNATRTCGCGSSFSV